MQTTKTSRALKYTVWIIGAIALALIVRQLPIKVWTDAVLVYVEGLGLWAPFAFALIYALATVLFLPGLILTLAAGAVFGLMNGFITVSVGSTVGAALAFLISRYLARERVARAAEGNVKFRAIDGAIGEGGWKIVALLRLSPAVPFNLQNYLFGLTRVRFWPYTFTSWLAMMPGTFLYVYLGHLSGAALGSGRERTTWEWIMLAAGLVATIVVTWYVTRLAQRQLEKQAQIAPEGRSVSSATSA